jgi:hypothetical protein
VALWKHFGIFSEPQKMNLKERMSHLVAAQNDEGYRKLFVERCSRDTVFWINTCCWTFDPRLRGFRRWLPFMLFPRQEEYVRSLRAAIDGDYDLLTEKSRDTGETWCKLAVLLWYWLFEQGFTALIGSIKEEKVEKKGDPSSMFWKLDFLLDNQPVWLRPEGYKPTQPWRTHLKMQNPVSGSVITGESSNPDFGRSGRYKCIFPDEFASWENAAPAWTSCQESTECRLPGSTPKGMNFFGRLANPSEGTEAILKFRLHWKDDPRHNVEVKDPVSGKLVNPWYEKQKKRYAYDETMMAQELDINYNRSMRGRVYPQIDYVKLGRFARNPNFPLYTTWDFGRTDATAILWLQWNTRRNRYEAIDYVQQTGMTIDFYVPFITGSIPTGTQWTYTPSEIEKIGRHEGWVVTEHYGDPAGKQRNQVTNTSVIETLQNVRTEGAPNGIYIRTNEKAKKFETRHHAAQMLLTRLDVDQVNCSLWLEAMRDAKFAQKGEGVLEASVASEPVHDWTSHGRTAWEFFAVNEVHSRDRFSDGDAPAGITPEEIDEGDYEAWLDAPRGVAGY